MTPLFHNLRSFTMLLLGLSMLLPGGAAVAAAPEPAAQVIVARGAVHAQMPGGERRDLRRRSPVYSGETIVTAAASEVQLRFSDGALLALRAETVFRIDDYRYQTQGGSGDRSVSTLIKGGLRTITGVIGKQDPQAYRVDTPVATIGVRGTHYEAVMESPESLVLAAWQGAIEVRNEQGVIELGVGAAHNFARTEARQRPRGLLQPPATLQNESPVGLSEPAATASTQTKPAASEQTDAGQTDTAAVTDAEALGIGTEGDPAETTITGTGVTGTGSALGATADTGCSTCTPPQQIVVNDTTALPASADLRFSATEWNLLQSTPYLGIGVEAGGDAFLGFDGGRTLYHGTNSPVITDNEYGPHELEYATAPIVDVIRRGNAAVDAFHNYSVDAGHTVYWGTWNGNVEPFEIQTDASDPTVKELIYAPYHWLTLLPTDQAAMAARTGSVNFSNVVVAHGGGSGGGPLSTANVFFTADVDFDSGAVTSGAMNIYNGPEAWNVYFSGMVRGSVLDVNVDPVASTVSAGGPAQAVDGDMGMVFTGSSGQALGGGFMFQSIADPATHVEGVLIVE
ncbi:MAG: FecR domain-containing protein [Gammaproteobacteria bacterium]